MKWLQKSIMNYDNRWSEHAVKQKNQWYNCYVKLGRKPNKLTSMFWNPNWSNFYRPGFFHQRVSYKTKCVSLREKCPYSELFWSKCGKIRTRITPNTDTFYPVCINWWCTHSKSLSSSTIKFFHMAFEDKFFIATRILLS